MQSLGYIWLDIVSEFSRLRLTVEADRMPALSGLANSLSTTTLGSYLAGIWSNDIARGLLFERARTSASENHPYGSSTFCSFMVVGINPLGGSSAISYDSVLRYGFMQDSNLKVVDAHCSPIGKNHFSCVTDGVLRLRGNFVPS